MVAHLASAGFSDYLVRMELLEQLEQRVGTLLERLDALARENESLKKTQADELGALAEENHNLRQQLEQEQSLNQTALTRITDLLQRIRERTEHE